MILIDYSQVAIANLKQQLKQGPLDAKQYKTPGMPQNPVNPDMLRHMILNSLRKINCEFGQKYGLLVLCTDNSNFWRKGFFQHYKAHRKKDRDDSGIDWGLVFQTLNELRVEIKETFPYKVMNVSMAEADDVIGVIAKHFHSQEEILIISGDKDFMQLQRYPGVCQYSSASDKFLKTDDPTRFLKEHIIRGDRGDGIPNFLSNDDVFVTGTRQSSIFETKLNVWLLQTPEEFCDETTMKHYCRNQKLVDLTQIPEAIEAAILEEFKMPIQGSRDKLFSYFMKHRMREMLAFSRDF